MTLEVPVTEGMNRLPRSPGDVAIHAASFGTFVAVDLTMSRVVVPAIFPEQAVFEQHDRVVFELRTQNAKLQNSLSGPKAASDWRTAQTINQRIAHNEQQIAVEKAQYPQGYNANLATFSPIATGVVLAAVASMGVRRAVKRHRRRQAA